MLFNSHQSLTYKDITMTTNIPAEELKRHLMSLYVNPKAKILVKLGGADKEKSKDPQDEDVFQVNMAFECKFFRVKVPLMLGRSGEGAGGTKQEGGDSGNAVAGS